MTDVYSERPLLKVGSKTIDAIGEFQELLRVTCDSGVEYFIGDIILEVDATTTEPHFSLWINGTEYIKDLELLLLAGSFGFGRHLKMTQHHKPLIIKVKTAAIGTLKVAAIVTGLEIPVNKQ